MTDAKHESCDPASESDFHTYVAGEESSAEPGDSCCRTVKESFIHAVAFYIGSARMAGAILGTRGSPESACGNYKLDAGQRKLGILLAKSLSLDRQKLTIMY